MFDLRACMHRSRRDKQESDGVIWHGRRNKSDSSRKHMRVRHSEYSMVDGT